VSTESAYVYTLPHPSEPGFTKIGITGDLTARLRGYQTGAPGRNYVFAATWEMESIEDARAVEAAALAVAREAFPVRNEWVKAPVSILVGIIEDEMDPL
jgi:hypothetical protein